MEKREMLTTDNNTEAEDAGTREIPFSKELFIEADDFMETPEKKFLQIGSWKDGEIKKCVHRRVYRI